MTHLPVFNRNQQAGTSNLPVGATLGLTVEEESDIPAAKAYAASLASAGTASAAAPSAAAAAPAAAAAAAAPAAAAAAGASAGYSHRLPFTPAVAHMLATLHLDPASIAPTGPKGRLLKGDVILAVENKTARALSASSSVAAAAPAAAKRAAAAAAAPAAAPSLPGMSARRRAARTHTDVPLSTPAVSAAASAQTAAKLAVPHLYLQAQVPSAALHAFCAAAGVTVESFVTRAAAAALEAVAPAATALVSLPASAAAAAEAVDGGAGRLAVPVASAATAPLAGIAAALAARRGEQLRATGGASAVAGGAPVVAVTVLAASGSTSAVSFGSDILPAGAVAAVTVGAQDAGAIRAHGGMVVDVDAAADGAFAAAADLSQAKVVATTMLSLTVDASVVDEVAAAKALQRMAAMVQNPVMMLV